MLSLQQGLKHPSDSNRHAGQEKMVLESAMDSPSPSSCWTISIAASRKMLRLTAVQQQIARNSVIPPQRRMFKRNINKGYVIRKVFSIFPTLISPQIWWFLITCSSLQSLRRGIGALQIHCSSILDFQTLLRVPRVVLYCNIQLVSPPSLLLGSYQCASVFTWRDQNPRQKKRC